jgi:hypothetical protein
MKMFLHFVSQHLVQKLVSAVAFLEHFAMKCGLRSETLCPHMMTRSITFQIIMGLHGFQYETKNKIPDLVVVIDRE